MNLDIVKKLPTFDSINYVDKVALVRVDLNVPLQDGVIQDTTRIERILPTLEKLIKGNAKVVLLSHLGRPKGKEDKSLSLSVLVPTLSRLLQQPVAFEKNVIGLSPREAINRLIPGQVILLENLRFHAEEEADDPKFAQELASLGDIYINDGFAVSHRAHASVHAITQFIPSYAGCLMKDELLAVSQAYLSPSKPVMAIIGGSKVSTKLSLLKNLVNKIDFLVIGGGIANTFLAAGGFNVGASLVENEMTASIDEIKEEAQKYKCKIVIPTDAKVAAQLSSGVTVREIPLREIQPHEKIFDIGHETVEEIKAALSQCNTVIWNGPLGVFETPPFDQGTTAVAQAIAQLHQKPGFYSLAGGGETLAAIKRSGTSDQFSYLSTGGGALLEFLEGKQLPGIIALLQQSNQNHHKAESAGLMENRKHERSLKQ